MRDRAPGSAPNRAPRRLTVVADLHDGDERPQPWHWQLFGVCRDVGESLFFHPAGERGSTRRRRDAAAKAICATCPVLMLCREQSLRSREPFGVWGGLSEVEREVVLVERDARLAERTARLAERSARRAERAARPTEPIRDAM